MGFLGLVLLVLPRGGSGVVPLVGALTVVAAATCWSVGSFLSNRLRMPADPFVATVYEMVAGAVALAVLSLARGELRGFSLAQVTTRSWLALTYLWWPGRLVAFTAYVWLLAHAPISLASTYAYVNPVVAVALGALLVAEPITGQVLLGGAVIVAGVALVVTTERPRRPACRTGQPPGRPAGNVDGRARRPGDHLCAARRPAARLARSATPRCSPGPVSVRSVGLVTAAAALGALAGLAAPRIARAFPPPPHRAGVRSSPAGVPVRRRPRWWGRWSVAGWPPRGARSRRCRRSCWWRPWGWCWWWWT